jgi:hypothetical protein
MSQAQTSPGTSALEPFAPRARDLGTPPGAERRLPYRLALPLIAGLSLGLWALIWQGATLIGRALTG